MAAKGPVLRLVSPSTKLEMDGNGLIIISPSHAGDS